MDKKAETGRGKLTGATEHQGLALPGTMASLIPPLGVIGPSVWATSMEA